MTKEKTITGFVPRTFRDAGTGETFEGGKEHQFTAGEHANYSAAGKITDKPKVEKAEKPTTPPAGGGATA